METVLISGGNGLVGRRLSEKLAEKGYTILILTRSPESSARFRNLLWDPEKSLIDPEAVAAADHIVHLAGENLGEKRWTKIRRQQIIDSRVKTGDLLFNKTRESGKAIKSFISASAIGYYGSVTTEKIYSESEPPANDFAAQVCKLWEHVAIKFEELGIRSVRIRSGIVLSPGGGALEKMTFITRIGLGSPLGRGDQYLPWIHIDDLCGIYVKAIEDKSIKGVYNAATPDYKTNREFTRTLASVLHKPFIAPSVPEFVLKSLYGEMATMLLNGSRVSPEKIISEGYSFLFPDLRNALIDVLKK